MSLKNILITGSIGSIPSQSYGQKTYIPSTDEQSIPLEIFSGSNGGSMPDLNGNISSSNLFINITQSWNTSIVTPLGIVNSIHNTQDEFINGELSGSNLQVSHQRLVDEDCIELLNVNPTLVNYKIYFYSSSITPGGYFLNSNTSPKQGEIYLLYEPPVQSLIGF